MPIEDSAESGSGKPRRGNLFSDLPEPATGEVFEPLLQAKDVTVERITSSSTPDDTSYDQPADEWVCLLQGEAELTVAGERVRMRAGDYLHLPARTPHRVMQTSANPRCVWLAVHLPEARPASGMEGSE
jgi:cupin 2 domain-containing protein